MILYTTRRRPWQIFHCCYFLPEGNILDRYIYRDLYSWIGLSGSEISAMPAMKSKVKQTTPLFLADLHPLMLTWNLKRSPQKRKFLLETIIFRFHVKFRGSNLWITDLWEISGIGATMSAYECTSNWLQAPRSTAEASSKFFVCPVMIGKKLLLLIFYRCFFKGWCCLLGGF